MTTCPISELMIVFDTGLPLFTWSNPLKKEITTGALETDKTDLIGGLFTAILTLSEDISGGSAVKQINMARSVFKYAQKNQLIFILGYDSSALKQYEPLIDEFLTHIMQEFHKKYKDFLDESKFVDSDNFEDFSSYMKQEVSNESRWKIEQTLKEVLNEIEELLLDILGPMAHEIYDSCLKKQKQRRKRRHEVELPLLATDLEYDLAMFMDITQAKQIGLEVQNIIQNYES
ncbi:MAG: hypothetical protein ACXAC7_18625 [Candidatus Hodarchaeales archaeon]|jgi:hypothetical protein